MKEYMKIKEAAKHLSMLEKSLYQHRSDGELAVFEVGGKILLRKSDLDAFMERRRVRARGVRADSCGHQR